MSSPAGTRGAGELVAAALMGAYVGAVALAGVLGVHREPLASSPAGVAKGHVLHLLTSGLPVAGPWLPATLLLAGSGIMAARAAGAQVAVVTALIAHVGGTLLAYGGLTLIRLHSPYYWESDWHAADYGVSLVFASWLALAAVRAPTRATGFGLAFVALAVARPAMSLTGAEHTCALAIGALCGITSMPRRRPRSHVPALLSH